MHLSKLFISTFRKNWLNRLGLFIILLVSAVAIAGSVLSCFCEDEINLNNRLQHPSAIHVFGTDELGRDIFIRVVVGAGISLSAAAIVLLTSAVLGLAIGSLGGLAGGWFDEIVARIIDLFLSIPSLIFSVSIIGILGPGLNRLFRKFRESATSV